MSRRRHGGRAAAEELLGALRAELERGTSVFGLELVTSRADDDGGAVVVYRDDTGALRGDSVNVFEMRRNFSPHTPTLLAGIWFGELDEPDGRGHVDVERARGLVSDPASVRWLGTE